MSLTDDELINAMFDRDPAYAAVAIRLAKARFTEDYGPASCADCKAKIEAMRSAGGFKPGNPYCEKHKDFTP